MPKKNSAKIRKKSTKKKSTKLKRDVRKSASRSSEIGVAQEVIAQKEYQDALKESEEKFRTLVEILPSGIYFMDLKGTFIYGNKAAEEIVGNSREHLIGKNFTTLGLFDKADIVRAVRLLARSVRGLPTGPDEYSLVRKDGSRRQILLRTKVLRLEGKRVILGHVEDITEQNKVITEIERSEERFRTLVENLPIGIYFNDMSGKFTYGNKAATDISGYSEKELIGKDLFRAGLLGKKDIPRALKILALNRLGKGSGPDEFIITRKDGKRVPIEHHTSVIRLKDGDFAIGMFQDVSRRYDAERNMRESEEKYRSIFNLSPDSIVLIDDKRRILDINERACDWMGFRRKDLVGKSFLEIPFITKKGKLTMVKANVKRLLGQKIEPYDVEFITKDGKTRIGRIRGSSILDENDKVTGVVILISDVTEAKKVEEEIKISEENYRSIFDNANDAIFIHDPQTGRILEMNDMAVKLYKYPKEKLLELTVGDLSEDSSPARQREAINRVRMASTGKPQLFEWRAKDRSGRKFWAEVSLKSVIVGKNKRVMAMVRDITERKRFEEEIRKAESDLKIRNLELEKFNRFAVGREMRMIELKKRLKELQMKLGEE